MDECKVISQRIKRIIKWLKDPSNQIFLSIILFAVIIRLYYFILTKSQPLWWDEAEYINMARHFAFSADYVFDPIRQVLFPLIISFFLKISNTFFLPRLFLLLLSLASVIGMYFLGKEIYDKKVGILSAFFMSIFYLNLFFTYRLLVDMHSLTFFIFSAFFFYKYLKDNSIKYLYIAAVLIAIGTLFKLSTAFLLPAILIYFLITEKLNFLKKKEIWISALIFFLILSPYLIWGYFEFGGFVLLQSQEGIANHSYFQRLFTGGIGYLSLFPTYLSWAFLIIFLLGIASMYKLFFGFDILIKGKGENSELKRNLFLILIFLAPLVFFSMMMAHNEDRYILNSFPAVFAISSFFILRSYDYIKKKNKFFAVILIIILLGFTASFQLKSADSLIKNKVNSYSEVRQAGLLIKEISNDSDIVMTSSYPQIKCYAERETINFPQTKKEFESLLSSNKNIKFFIVSGFEYHPEWAYSYPIDKKWPVVDAYFTDNSKTKPLLVVYKINN